MGKHFYNKKQNLGLNSLVSSSLITKITTNKSKLKSLKFQRKVRYINKKNTVVRFFKQRNWLVQQYLSSSAKMNALGVRLKNSKPVKFIGSEITFSVKNQQKCQQVERIQNFTAQNALKYYGLNLILNKRVRGHKAFGNLKMVLTALRGANSFLGTLFNLFSSRANYRSLNNHAVIQRGLRLLLNRSFSAISFGVVEQTYKFFNLLGLIKKLQLSFPNIRGKNKKQKAFAIKHWKAFLYSNLKNNRFNSESSALILQTQIEKRGEILQNRFKWTSRGYLRARNCQLVRYDVVKQFSKIMLNSSQFTKSEYLTQLSLMPQLMSKKGPIMNDHFLTKYRSFTEAKAKVQLKVNSYGKLFSKARGDLILLKENKFKHEIPRFQTFKNQKFLLSMVKFDFLTVYNHSSKNIWNTSSIDNGLKLFNGDSFLGLNILEVNLQLKLLIQQLAYIRLFPNYKLWFWVPNKFIADLINAFFTRFIMDPNKFYVSVTRPMIESSRGSDTINYLIILGDVWTKESKASVWKYLNSNDLSLVTLMSLNNDRTSFGLNTISNDVIDYKKVLFILATIWNVLMLDREKVNVSSLVDQANLSYLNIPTAPSSIVPVQSVFSVKNRKQLPYFADIVSALKADWLTYLSVLKYNFFSFILPSGLKFGLVITKTSKFLTLEEKYKYLQILVKHNFKNSVHMFLILRLFLLILPKEFMIINAIVTPKTIESVPLMFSISRDFSSLEYGIFLSLFFNVQGGKLVKQYRANNEVSNTEKNKKEKVKKFKKIRKFNLLAKVVKNMKQSKVVKQKKRIWKFSVIKKKQSSKFKKIKKSSRVKLSKKKIKSKILKKKCKKVIKDINCFFRSPKYPKLYKFLPKKQQKSYVVANYLWVVTHFDAVWSNGLSVNPMLMDGISKKSIPFKDSPTTYLAKYRKYLSFCNNKVEELLIYKQKDTPVISSLPIYLPKLKINPLLNSNDPRWSRKFGYALDELGFASLPQIIGRKYNPVTNTFVPFSAKREYIRTNFNKLQLKKSYLKNLILTAKSLVSPTNSPWIKNYWDNVRVSSLLKSKIQRRYNRYLAAQPWRVGEFDPKSSSLYKLLGSASALMWFRKNSMRNFSKIHYVDLIELKRKYALPKEIAFFTKRGVLKTKPIKPRWKPYTKLLIHPHPVDKIYLFSKGQNNTTKLAIRKAHALSNNDTSKPGHWYKNLSGVSVFISKPYSEFTPEEVKQFSNKVRKALWWKEHQAKQALKELNGTKNKENKSMEKKPKKDWRNAWKKKKQWKKGKNNKNSKNITDNSQGFTHENKNNNKVTNTGGGKNNKNWKNKGKNNKQWQKNPKLVNENASNSNVTLQQGNNKKKPWKNKWQKKNQQQKDLNIKPEIKNNLNTTKEKKPWFNKKTNKGKIIENKVENNIVKNKVPFEKKQNFNNKEKNKNVSVLPLNLQKPQNNNFKPKNFKNVSDLGKTGKSTIVSLGNTQKVVNSSKKNQNLENMKQGFNNISKNSKEKKNFKNNIVKDKTMQQKNKKNELEKKQLNAKIGIEGLKKIVEEQKKKSLKSELKKNDLTSNLGNKKEGLVNKKEKSNFKVNKK